jgi:putative tricarboxylic transport membrane protein
MKFNDALFGVLLIIFGAAIGWHISSYPEMSGQKFGPAVFPGMIAAGLAACGLLLALRTVRVRAPVFEIAAWTRSPVLASNFALICAALIFYIVAADTLGFLITGTLLLFALFRKFGVSALQAALVAPGSAIVIHLLFYKMLRVPLPWGLLEFMAGW